MLKSKISGSPRGHERGAFTGAIAQKIGRLELADNGSLFLNEVGDIPVEIQPKLLRALQEREFERSGSNRTQRVDVRLVAATNRELEKMMENREFRSDLYYRLNVFPIRIPLLRERPEDIPLLVGYFTQTYGRLMNKKIESVPPGQLVLALSQYECKIFQAGPPANGGYVLCRASAPQRQNNAPLTQIPSRGLRGSPPLTSY
jgi:transcriptional regulator with GAF, ATPase, and Fis domain